MATAVRGLATGKKTTLEGTPAGPGFTTVTEAVLAVAMFAAGTVALNREPLMNCVSSALPFQCTTEPETKPAPFMVSVNDGPPGAAASGTKGWLIKGTGFSTRTPLPVRGTTCGLPSALSVIVTLPVLVPACVGVNVTLMVQLALDAIELPQVLLWAKSPLAAMPLTLKAAEPKFVSVMLFEALVT